MYVILSMNTLPSYADTRLHLNIKIMTYNEISIPLYIRDSLRIYLWKQMIVKKRFFGTSGQAPLASVLRRFSLYKL